jgi:hypothetical protein
VRARGDGDADGVLESGALQGLDFGGHGGGEEVGVARVAGEGLEDVIEDLTEVEIEEAVGFVEDEVLEVLEREAFGVGEVVEETA